MKSCPQRDLLVAYESGGLGNSESEPIERHLESCPTCRDVMGRIRNADDFAKKLRTVMPVVTGLGGGTAVVVGRGEALPDATTMVLQDDAGGLTGERASLQCAEFGAAEWTIPDYDRVVLCDEGSYGTVWAVRDRVGVHRALKVIDLERMKRLGVECRERSALEAYCRRMPRDPHLISIYHVGIVDNLLYYTMDLADDYTTRGPVREVFPASYRPLTLEMVLRGRPLAIDVSIEIVRRLLHGLRKLHEAGLVHRDVKPSNIVFVDQRPKLADIGIVTTDGETSLEIGTPTYMPPDRVMDKTADTYALGKVLYEMLAGRGSAGFPIPPADRRWTVSRWNRNRVSRVIARACADTAAERYDCATAMLGDLEQCVELTVESLFDDLDEAELEPPPSTAREAIRLGYAFLRTIPWIFGIIALLLVISLLTA